MPFNKKVHLGTIWGIFLLSLSGKMSAHVADFHFRTPDEEQMMENVRKERQHDQAQEILQNEGATDEEKVEAFFTLLDNMG